jgi:ADP-heptose:LPS heptosyltransferase
VSHTARKGLSISTLRTVDRWLATPLCFLLTVFRRFREPGGARPKPDAIDTRRILFVKLAEQGATVLAYAAITSAVQRVGATNVYFLVFEQNRFILDALGLIPPGNVITVSQQGLLPFVTTTIRALLRLRRLRIDAAIDFEFFARGSAVLTYLCGARVRIGFHSHAGEGPYRGDLMTHRVIFNPHIHTSQMFQVLVGTLDVPAGQLPVLDIELPPVQGEVPGLSPASADLDRVRTIVQQAAGTTDFSPLILLNSNASDLLPLRRWPDGNYAELARRLLARSSTVRIGFTGGPDETAVADEIVRSIGSERCFSLAGKTTLRELLALYCLADAMVTNDSGPALFATLTPMRVVTLFGPETPLLFGSASPRTSVLWARLPCSPCVSAYNDRRSACTDNVCMQRISVDEVLQVVCGISNL